MFVFVIADFFCFSPLYDEIKMCQIILHLKLKKTIIVSILILYTTKKLDKFRKKYTRLCS